MTLRMVLRGIAVLIAILGAIDPALTLPRRTRQPLIIVIDAAAPQALTSAARARELLQDEYDVRVREISSHVTLPACATGESCILIGGDRWPKRAIDAAARVVGAVRIEPRSDAGVTITDVTDPTGAHASAAGQLVVRLAGRGVTGQQSTIDVLDEEVPVGRAVHTWAGEDPVTIPIEWWPMGGGPRHLSVRTSRGTAADDQVDIAVNVSTMPYNVLVYDARPSWTSTFVRRAIERDTRLAVRVVARLGPRLQVTEGEPFQLDDRTLTDASAVIVGAPEALSARDVDALERFVRVRGGSLILVPDRAPTGPIVRLLPSPATERLEPSPVRVGEWRASELLVFRDARPDMAILATVNKEAVVLSAASGNGRVLVSGAMDAWRYRDAEANRFDRAWRSLIPDVAMAGGRPLEITLDRSLVGLGDEVHATVRMRAMAPLDSTVAVGATIACEDEQPRIIRLWPTGDRRRFQARTTPSRLGTCHITVASTVPIAATATASFIVREDIHSGAIPLKVSDPSPLSELITDRMGGQIVEPGDEMALARDVQRALPAAMAPAEVRVLRSPWWIMPFAACLGAEWWLRRRRGLR